MRTLSFLLFALLLISCSKEKRAEKAADKMRDFVIELSEYAKAENPNFLIIPQNGIELCFNYESLEDGFSTNYMNAIDGVGVEELFYNSGVAEEDGRIAQAEEIGQSKSVLVADYVNPNSNMNDAFAQSDQRGFIAFPRAANGYDYQFIPDSVHNENANDINTLGEAQNFLYLISTTSYSSKSDFLNAIAASNFDVVLIDLFFEGDELTSSEIQSLKTKANGGKRLVIAYMNIGAAETYRYYWQEKWKKGRPNWIKKEYDGYPDEYWVKFWKKDWKEIIYGNDESYTKKLLNAGFDGAYLDNVEVYYYLYFDE
ncbi:MAG: endo alpha-1,4 polygalactosaminidase [Flavobacteriales bacterium]|nr:endo alpha-1,4 polygalactosaminidase [Flavobacteriales bacterium]